MLAARLTVLRPALRTLLRPKTTKAKDMVDPTTTSAWWKEWAGQNHQGFFNVGAAFFLTVLASQNYSGRLERAALQADLAAAQNEAAALRARAADDAAIADAAKRLWGETGRAAKRNRADTGPSPSFAGPERDVAGAGLRDPS